ncbi:MAG: DsbC family protein [Methylococcaceae bacterium]|nr:DsbC family protein [Methylococcaceae bacterium]
MKKFTRFSGLMFALYLPFIFADDAAIKKALEKSMPTAVVESIKPSEIKGLNEVVLGSSIYYVSDDGKYLLEGRMIDMENRVDLTNQKLGGIRKLALDKLGPDKMITFKAKNEKYKVFIFTDIDCGYCRKLHSEIDQYLAEGISINYLFFPRAGKGSESYYKAVSVWCAKDRNAALTAAKKDQKLDNKSCENPVDNHMKLAEGFDVKGTPMIVTDHGNIFPGYLPPKELLKALQTEKIM